MGLESIYKLSVIVNMVDQISAPMRGVTDSFKDSMTSIEKMELGFGGLAKSGAVMTSIGSEITKAVLEPVAATFETEKALGELSSLGIENLKALEKAATDFSNKFAGTTKSDFISAAYDIKSGIASLTDEGVAEYTALAGLTAKATKATTGEMTSLFATGYGIYKNFYNDLSDVEFGEMFSAGIAKSVQQFKTDGSQMAGAIQTLGATATSANVPLEEQLSIMGMLQATMSGSEAGTKYKAFLNAAAGAGKKLGLSFVDANNNLLSTPEILEKLRGKFGETMDAAEKMQLKEAFGTDEAVAMIDLLYSKTGDLDNNISAIQDSMGEGTSVAQGMADAINGTSGEQYQVLKQQADNLKQSLGTQLLPTVNNLMEKGVELLGKVNDFASKNQNLVRSIMLVVLAIGIVLSVAGAFITVIGGIGLVFTKTISTTKNFVNGIRKIPDHFNAIKDKATLAGNTVKSSFDKIKNAANVGKTAIGNVSKSVFNFGKTAVINGVNACKSFVTGMIGMAKQAVITAVTAMPGLIASVWGFTTALLANPITWVVVGIIAFVASIILLWQNWDLVKAKVTGAIQTISTMVGTLASSIGSKITAIGNSIKTGFTSAMQKAKSAVTQGINNIKLAIDSKVNLFRQSGIKIMTTFADGIKQGISKAVNAVKGGLQKIRNMLPFSDAKEGPLSKLTLSGRKVFETINEGMQQSEDLPAQTTEKSFKGMSLNLEKEKSKKVNLREVFNESKEQNKETSRSNKSGVSINTLNIKVDMSSIKDLKLLSKLLKELEDIQNSDGEFEEDMDMVFA